MIYSVPDHVFYGKPLLLKCIKKIGGGRGLKKISQRGGLVRINFLQVNFWKVYVSSVRMFLAKCTQLIRIFSIKWKTGKDDLIRAPCELGIAKIAKA